MQAASLHSPHVGGWRRETHLGLQLFQEPREERRGRDAELRVEALFEARRGVAAQPQPHGGSAHDGRLEVGHFQQELPRFARDLRGLAAHHAGQGDGFLSGTDQQVGGNQLALGPIQGRELLAGPRIAHVDAGRRQAAAVEDVVGLPEVEHHEVREVDQLIVRLLPHGEQEPAQPVGRGQGLGSVDGQRQVARAVARMEGDREGRPVPGGGHLGCPGLQLAPEDGRHLARQPAMTPKIGAMRQGLVVDLEHPVFDVECLRDGGADRGLGIEHPDAVVLLPQLELAHRTDHAARFDAADLGLLDLHAARQHGPDPRHRDLLSRVHVGCAADDRGGLLTVTGVDLTNRELVRVGVRDALHHRTDDHVGQVRREGREPLDFGRRQGQLPRQLLGRDAIQVDVARQPAHGYQHQNCSRKRRSPPMK